MKRINAAGILLFSKKMKYFLLMKHPKRWDLPKGHLESGEDFLEGAIREFEEETGINKDKINIFNNFLFETKYYPPEKRYNNEVVEKTLRIYLAKLKIGKNKIAIKLTEHNGFEWVKWSPPHKIQQNTIDPLLEQVEVFL